MIKYSLAVALLLGSGQDSNVQAVKVHHKSHHKTNLAKKQNLIELDSEHTTPKHWSNDKFLLEVDENLNAQFNPTSCTSGIDRWSSAGNSQQTFQNAQSGGLYEDPDFGADDSTLFWDGWGGHNPAPGALWKRPSEMGAAYSNNPWEKDFPYSPSLWGKKGKPIPNGVSQGSLGSCWFLASASALAEQPERITKIFANGDYSSTGAFRVNFWSMNKWVGINIDDRLPAYQYGASYKPNFTGRSASEAWWTPLLEKAFAKFNQNFQRIESGAGFEALKAMSGMPTLYLQNSDPGMGSNLKFFASQNYPMTSGCCAGGVALDGLTSGHAYTLLDIVDLTDSSGAVAHTIAKMRNPWGSEAYNGAWRDDDPAWTAEWKQQVGLAVANDGVFWMPYENFISKFTRTSVALYRDDYQLGGMDLTLTSKNNKFIIKNPTKQWLYFSVEGKSERNYPRVASCKPKGEVVLYYTDSNGSPVQQDYEYIGFANGLHTGTVGKFTQEMDAGDYNLNLYLQSGGPVDVSVRIYYTSEFPSVYNA